MSKGNPFGQSNQKGPCVCSEVGGGCGRRFPSLAAFDAHLIGPDRECQDPGPTPRSSTEPTKEA